MDTPIVTIPFIFDNPRNPNHRATNQQLTITPLKINGWNIIPWRFGSDHFPFISWMMAVGSYIRSSSSTCSWFSPTTRLCKPTLVCISRIFPGATEALRFSHLSRVLGRGSVGECLVHLSDFPVTGRWPPWNLDLLVFKILRWVFV